MSLLLAEPETQGRLVGESQRPFRYTEDPFKSLCERRHRSPDVVERDPARLPGEEVVRGELLKTLHEREEDLRGLLGGRDGERTFVHALSDDPGEERNHEARAQPAELLPDDRVAVRVPDLHDRDDQV